MAVAANYAGFVPRLVSLIIDVVILIVVQLVLAVVLSVLGDAGSSLAQGLGVLIALAYDVYFFTSTGQTPGMKVMSIKLVNASGEIITMGQAIVRVVVAYISGIALGIGYLWMLWDGNKQTWHDKAATSFVVRV
ncbi:MAG: RDD family protein [Chloroflexota bacterium]